MKRSKQYSFRHTDNNLNEKDWMDFPPRIKVTVKLTVNQKDKFETGIKSMRLQFYLNVIKSM